MENVQHRQRVSRAPNGMDPGRVNVPLTPAEKAELQSMAFKEVRSVGALARLIYLRGLEVLQAEKAAAEQVQS